MSNKVKNKITGWLKKQVKKSGARGIVLGISGGLDSSVVAVLAKEALAREGVLGLILPCHSQRQDLKDARLVVKKLKIKSKTIDLSEVYDSLLEVLPGAGRSTRANLKARLRMAVLYYFANTLGYLVCGTSNKSELMAGYFTKYGDGAADILPLGDLLKRQVWALAEELGIPKGIIIKPPTAGLWPGQTDEGEMGISYQELDDILERRENNRKQVISSDTVEKVRKMFQGSEHKRQRPQACYI